MLCRQRKHLHYSIYSSLLYTQYFTHQTFNLRAIYTYIYRLSIFTYILFMNLNLIQVESLFCIIFRSRALRNNWAERSQYTRMYSTRMYRIADWTMIRVYSTLNARHALISSSTYIHTIYVKIILQTSLYIHIREWFNLLKLCYVIFFHHDILDITMGRFLSKHILYIYS